jgi:tetratricopeptide (TPR) repeat protein
MEVATTYMSMRKYKKAESWYQRYQVIVPNDAVSMGYLAYCYILNKGDINAAQSTLKSIKKIEHHLGETLGALILINLVNKNYQRALNLFDSLRIEYSGDQNDFWDKHCVKSYIYHLLGDTLKSYQYADSSLILIHKEMRKNPNDSRYHSALGVTHAFHGNKNEAISAAIRATEIYPVSLNALDGPKYVYNLAWVYTILCKYDNALEQLEYLLSIQAGKVVSKTSLRIDPKWGNLHDHPRFQVLIE